MREDGVTAGALSLAPVEMGKEYEVDITETIRQGEGERLQQVAGMTKSYSGADIEALCREAAMNALRMDVKSNEVAVADFNFLMKLFFLGFVLVFLGVVVLVVAAWFRADANISGGVIIIIGFIPIIVGAGPHAFIAILIAAILMIISFLVFVWMRKQVCKG